MNMALIRVQEIVAAGLMVARILVKAANCARFSAMTI
jgi:hypothetical protein